MNEIQELIPNIVEKVKNYLPIFYKDTDFSEGSVSYNIIASTIWALYSEGKMK